MDLLSDLRINYQLLASVIAAIGSVAAAAIGFLNYRQSRPGVDLVTDMRPTWEADGQDDKLRIIIFAHITARGAPQRVDRVSYEEIARDGTRTNWDRMLHAAGGPHHGRTKSDVPKVVTPESPGRVKLLRYFDERPRVCFVRVMRDEDVVEEARIELAEIWDANVPEEHS